MADAPKTSETAIAQNEISLSVLRETALRTLLEEGRESAYTSSATATDKGRQIETVNNKTKDRSTIIINGKAVGVHRGLSLDTQVKGDFVITHVRPKGNLVEKAEFELTGTDWDEFWGRTDKFTISMKRTDATGKKAVETYLPAISEEQHKDNRAVLDPNGQPLRIARLANGDANCRRDNIDNPRNSRVLCEYILRRDQSQDLSYNETREKFPSSIYYRSVVRDMQGKVLGIVEQSYKTDANGDLLSATTSARRPLKLKK